MFWLVAVLRIHEIRSTLRAPKRLKGKLPVRLKRQRFRTSHGPGGLANGSVESADVARDGESSVASQFRFWHRFNPQRLWQGGSTPNPSGIARTGWPLSSLGQQHRCQAIFGQAPASVDRPFQSLQQSSRPRDVGLKKDASAQLLWRFAPRRVEAEVIRDSILQASGHLDESIGGPSYRHSQCQETLCAVKVVDNHSQSTWRRMLYQERMRRVDDRIFTAFDFPDCGQVRAKRPVSTTPLQALNLMNSDFSLNNPSCWLNGLRKTPALIHRKMLNDALVAAARKPSDDELAAGIRSQKNTACRCCAEP